MTEFGAAASSASSTSSSISKWPYHVFLSFRGEDTRYGFTGNLYRALRERGIRTFIDDEGIRKGEEITPTLLKTIKESKTAIVVFSKDYASSTFCLKELAQILDCMKEPNDRFIWPVFYDIDPSDIRHQMGSYKEAFDKYEADKDESTVKRWRLALTEAANMTGWPFDPRSGSYEYKTIDDIVQDVSKVIGIGLLHVARFPVGLESRVEYVCSLLNKEPHCEGATIVGIFGPGGIGKTTIARATYNEIAISFKDKCFLDNIKEYSICEVQERLLSEILGLKDIKLKDYKNGISVITDRLYDKKVLLVLDDISAMEQLRALAGELNWFGSGSKIIITTRDKSLLQNYGIYEVPELSGREIRQLLILNAFKKEEEDPEYKEVINRAVKYGFGLPLALETFGSTFGHHKTVKEMESFLDIQEKFPNKTILQSLKVSYDSLEELYKEVFLDIACFYRGYSLRYATKILSARYGIDSEYCINILIDKSLVKLGERGYFDESGDEERWYLNMHDLIQDMGQEIVRQESPDVGQRSRLWSKEDILHVLNENTGTATIQTINIFFEEVGFDDEEEEFEDEEVEWSGEGFEKMKNLKVLSFSCSSKKIYQGPKCLPNSLRVVEWDYYPSLTLPEDFCLINLVILRLRNSHLKTLGKACKNISNLLELDLSFSQNLEELPDLSGALNLEKIFNLRELNLQGCENLEELSDISGAACIEALDVSYCKNLTKIDDSVGHLVKLRVLNAERCEMLDKFIVGGIGLVSLEILNLCGCSKLHIFPEILVNMKMFKTFDLRYTAIKTLPESIEKLVALEALYLSGCKELRQLPNLALHDLKILNLDWCKELEEIRGILSNIEVFCAQSCTSLTSHSTRLLLTQKFFNLRKLNLQGCENLEEVPDISGASCFEELNVSYCMKLTKIDDSVGHLAKLRVLNAERCEMLDKFIIGGIGLVSLEILNLFGCSKLHTFPEILVNMKKIKTFDLRYTAIKTLPESIEKLVALEALYLSGCKELRQLPNLALHNLKMLNLDWCKELEEIREIPSSIEVFCAQSCTSLTSHSTRLLLRQGLHENGNTQFILPGKEIPKWFHKHSTGNSVSFWVRKKFPQIALCAILKNGPLFAGFIRILINGTHKIFVKDVILSQWVTAFGIDHIILFDLRKQVRDFKIGRDLLEEELNHVVVSCYGLGTGFVEGIGVYVYNYDSWREDILFENTGPQSRTPVEVAHQIYNSDLDSSSVFYDDWRDIRDRIEKGLILFENPSPQSRTPVEVVLQICNSDLKSPSVYWDDWSDFWDRIEKETISNVEKEKGQLKVDDVNSTLSLSLLEPSSDTTNHHDDKLNQEIMDPSTTAVSSIRKERKLEVDDEHLTLSLALPEPSSDTTSHHDLQQQQHLSSFDQDISESSGIVKQAKEEDIIVFGGNANEKKVTCQNCLLSSNNEILTWDPMEWESQLTREKDQSTIIGKDDKLKHEIIGPSTEVVSSIKEKEINLEVDGEDRSSFSTLLGSSSDSCNILEVLTNYYHL